MVMRRSTSRAAASVVGVVGVVSGVRVVSAVRWRQGPQRRSDPSSAPASPQSLLGARLAALGGAAHSCAVAGPLRAQPPPRVLESATSQVAILPPPPTQLPSTLQVRPPCSLDRWRRVRTYLPLGSAARLRAGVPKACRSRGVNGPAVRWLAKASLVSGADLEVESCTGAGVWTCAMDRVSG